MKPNRRRPDRAPVRVTQPTRPNIVYQVRARPPPGGAVVGCAEDTTTTISSVAKAAKVLLFKKTTFASLRTGHGLATPDSSDGPSPGRASRDSLSTVTWTVGHYYSATLIAVFLAA